MDEKENIIKCYRKTGESLTNLTGFSFDTRVGATANAFVLLKFLIKEPLQQQLPYQKTNYYFALIRVTSLSCEKVHRTFSAAIRLRESEINFVFCEWELYVGTAPRAKDEKRQKRQELDVLAVFPIPPSATSCTHLPLQGRQIGLFNSGSPKSVIFLGRGERNGAFIINFLKIYSNTEFLSTRRVLAALSKSKNSVSCETLHILDTRVGATANAFVLLKFSIKELLQLQLLHQKINYYFTLIRVTSLSCEKVHRTFSTKIKQRFLRNAAYFGHSCWRNRQRFCLIKVFD